MILSAGIDMTNISRIKKLTKKYGEKFLQKILSQKEIQNIPTTRREEYIAGRFAAKEALAKATEKKFSLNNISILNDENGKPFFDGDFFTKDLAGLKIHLSISHDADYAIAFVIIERP